jgi:ssDNA-binding Zn-finger/Zn-ribbon topoisomerase 1
MGFVMVAAIVLLLSRSKRSTEQAEYPYARNDVLFSAAERSFLGVLEKAAGDEHRVFGKVRVADVISVKSMKERAAWQRAFNRINAKHFDFLICAKDELTIEAAIELNDQSHESRKRRDRDQFLVELCRAVSLPLLVVPAQSTYSVGELRAKVQSVLAGEAAPAAFEPMLREQEPPVCPKCAAPMVRRIAKKGATAGEEFWGCSAYPKCRGVIAKSA